MSFRKYPRQILITLVTAALILTACNAGTPPPPTTDANALNTAIVGTTVAQFSEQFTQTALAQPTNTAIPTDTPIPLPTFELPTANASALPGFTQLPSPVAPAPGATQALGDACNNNVFEGDVTILDGTVVRPGADFQKIWKVRNTGNCLWDEGYSLVYIGGSTPNLDPYTFEFKQASDFVSPGEAINIGINLTAPCTPGLYEGHWRMKNDQGYYFGTILSVYVEVKDKC